MGPPGQACPEFDIKIPISSVDSGNSNLDKHLRNADFFNEPEFPNMTFKSTGCTRWENKWVMTGELTLLGKTKTVNVNLERIGTADLGRGLRSGFEATFTIKRSEHGMTWGVERGSLGDTVKIIVSLETINSSSRPLPWMAVSVRGVDSEGTWLFCLHQLQSGPCVVVF